MDLEIIKSDGTSYLLSDYGVVIDDFKVGSIVIESNYGKVEGASGRIDNGATYEYRTIKVPFHIRAHDLLDFPLLRDTLYDLVLDTESFLVRELRRPKWQQYDFVDMTESAVDEYGNRKFSEESKNVYVGGKVYLVRLSNEFDVEQTLESGEGEMIFETTELPYAKSLGTSQDIQMNGISADSGLWGFGMGLIDDPESHIYTHTGTSFRIYNAGNVAIHPFEQELNITISSVEGSTEYFQIRNKHTGDTFRITEVVENSQIIVLDGPNVTSNGLQYFRNTNHRFIGLVPGWNEFIVTGASSVIVQFDFPFYYK
jgi:hypothetical protein